MLIDAKEGFLAITVPAKVNLFLEVIGKRVDGYHDLETVMSCVSLTDELQFARRYDGQISLKIEPLSFGGYEQLSPEDAAWDIPNDSRNLVYKALVALRDRIPQHHSASATQGSQQAPTNGSTLGIDVILRKGIPAQAGLGGGSADAAAAIVGGMLTWMEHYDHELASELASDLGSDINFFLDTAHAGIFYGSCTGRGEIVKTITPSISLEYVVIHPQLGCSTKMVFDQLSASDQPPADDSKFLDHDRKKTDYSHNVLTPRSQNDILREIREGDREAIAQSLWNRLSIPALQLNPWLGKIRKIIDSSPGVLGGTLSGSGSAMFAIMQDGDCARTLVQSLKEQNLYRVYHVKDWNSGKIVEQVMRLEANRAGLENAGLDGNA